MIHVEEKIIDPCSGSACTSPCSILLAILLKQVVRARPLQFQGQYFKRHIAIKGPVQEMPNFEARVSIDSRAKDRWGVPTLPISGQKYAEDLKTGQFIAEKAGEILQKVWSERGVVGTNRTMGEREPASGGNLPNGK